MADNRPIGIFDSGLGGLTAVNALLEKLPGESFIYLGDTARIPYGEKDADTILSYGRDLVGFLQEKDVKIIIAACGTVCSNAIEDLRRECDVPIIDVIGPGIKAALRFCEGKKRLGVIATEATVKSGLFQKMLKDSPLDADIIACPLFVPLIEDGMSDSIITASVVEASLRGWQENPLDALILGCTHYPLLSPAIQRVLGRTNLIDMSVAALEYTYGFLEDNGLLNETGVIRHKFYVSGDAGKFNEMAGKITPLRISADKIFW